MIDLELAWPMPFEMPSGYATTIHRPLSSKRLPGADPWEGLPTQYEIARQRGKETQEERRETKRVKAIKYRAAHPAGERKTKLRDLRTIERRKRFVEYLNEFCKEQWIESRRLADTLSISHATAWADLAALRSTRAIDYKKVERTSIGRYSWYYVYKALP